jgi:hypothetical protein
MVFSVKVSKLSPSLISPCSSISSRRFLEAVAWTDFKAFCRKSNGSSWSAECRCELRGCDLVPCSVGRGQLRTEGRPGQDQPASRHSFQTRSDLDSNLETLAQAFKSPLQSRTSRSPRHGRLLMHVGEARIGSHCRKPIHSALCRCSGGFICTASAPSCCRKPTKDPACPRGQSFNLTLDIFC